MPLDVMGSQSEWWEAVEQDGCLMWRAWVGSVCVVHPVLRKALELARQKVQREGA
jgi:hypothetical protein